MKLTTSGFTVWLAAGAMLAAAGVTHAQPETAGSLYQKECGTCHMAYPAEFLPSRSWQKLLTTLDEHFGENAELAPEDVQALQGYLEANAADSGDNRRGRKMLQGIDARQTPLRISLLPYFVRKHDEVPERMSIGNPEVKSMSRCDSCHTRAREGSFSEREVHIPGYRDWED
ncbi:MAG: diheme cytochrome c [Gammaproteobacteria bacterium]|nr:diheme cytochrome c [Gammaproteobacteria bacterium]